MYEHCLSQPSAQRSPLASPGPDTCQDNRDMATRWSECAHLLEHRRGARGLCARRLQDTRDCTAACWQAEGSSKMASVQHRVVVVSSVRAVFAKEEGAPGAGRVTDGPGNQHDRFPGHIGTRAVSTYLLALWCTTVVRAHQRSALPRVLPGS